MRQEGIVLLSTLLVILLLTFFLLAQMQAIYLANKMLNIGVEQAHFFSQLEKEAYALTQLNIPSQCMIKEQDPLAVRDLLIQKRGCTATKDKLTMHYVIEDLGVVPCMRIAQANTSFSTRHVRYTVMGIGKFAAFYQLRLAVPVKACACAEKQAVFVNPGLLSWHFQPIANPQK
ncbi:MAG: hypothetical protein WC785_02100 [Tatlockia sp.]|jgi:hypothetical protein